MTDPSAEVSWIVGVDIGGTTTSVGLVAAEGSRPRSLRTAPTRLERGGEAAVEWIVEAIEASIEEEGVGRDRVVGVGIGCPGPLDRTAGRVLMSPNLGWTDFPLRDLIAQGVGLPATLDNDANCAAYGEWWQGAGRGAANLVGITIGTGVGGGVLLGGELVRGATGIAGEVGHMTIDFAGRMCRCGNRGCLEAYVSGPSIAARAREGIEGGAVSALTERVGVRLERLTAATVSEAAAAGDRYAGDVMAETARLLGAGLASLVNLLNPEVIVIAGGVTRAGEALFGPLHEEVRRRAFSPGAEACRIVPARYPDEAGVIGAAGVFARENDRGG